MTEFRVMREGMGTWIAGTALAIVAASLVPALLEAIAYDVPPLPGVFIVIYCGVIVAFAVAAAVLLRRSWIDLHQIAPLA